MLNTYTEEFRRNAVAVIRTGFGIDSLDKRLHIPLSGIRNWMKNPRYADVPPAGGITEEAFLPERREVLGPILDRTHDFCLENEDKAMGIRINDYLTYLFM